MDSGSVITGRNAGTWTDSHALGQGLFCRAAFPAEIREGSLFPIGLV